MAYHNFLRTASEWLSHRATDKPVARLIFGVAAMLVSCLILLSLLFLLWKQVFSEQNHHFSTANKDLSWWHLDEIFILVVIVIIVISMGSSSLVEEEQYIWHFMTSSLYLLSLRKLLLQQPVNSMPVLFLFLQVLASIWYSSGSNQYRRQWVEVAALYYMGMAGHFGLGNTNTLATIDVAGAFIGVLNHSTVLSGILMFIITYASPMLYLLSMVMYNSVEDTSGLMIPEKGNIGSLLKRTLGFPCLVPLGLNSIFLISYTIVLLLMRNHLFVWSVFSPKFLYVCATTVCVCVGVSIVASTMIYLCLVLTYREKLHTHTD